MLAVPSETRSAELPGDDNPEPTTGECPRLPRLSLGDVLGINTAISVLFGVGGALGFGPGFGWLILLPVLIFCGLLLVQLPVFIVIGYFGGLFHSLPKTTSSDNGEQFLPQFHEHSAAFRPRE